jgi:hypothetical protein
MMLNDEEWDEVGGINGDTPVNIGNAGAVTIKAGL